MRIGLNLLYLIPGVVGGTETYAVSLVRALASIDGVNQYFLFVNRESAELELPDAANFHRVTCDVHATRRGLRYAWEQLVLPFQLGYYDLDLVHSLGYVGPLASPCPSIVTIPDLNYISLREFIPATRRRVLEFFSVQAARRSAQVITISHFSKAAIAREIKLNPDRITVTHLGAGWVEGEDNRSRDPAIMEFYHLPARYVVAFGGASPHKNIARLVSAFVNVAHEYPHSLVLLGHLPPDTDLESVTQRAGLRGRILTLGYVPREHIGPILRRADLFVLPSLYEGFGMPILEAQSSSVPVACATAGSLPEVAGDGAEFFDPLSVDDISRAMRRCLSDASLRAAMRVRGAQNVRRFTWVETARQTLNVYRSTYERLRAQAPLRSKT
jgi:glycosyltransferase involved in cell wall biosynthesis